MTARLPEFDQVIALYQQGKSRQEIEKITGKPTKYVYQALWRRFGKVRYKWRQPDPDEIVSKYKAGMSARSLAHQADVSCSVICRILKKKLGVEKLGRKNRSKLILDLFEQGLSRQAVAKKLGLSFDHVRRQIDAVHG